MSKAARRIEPDRWLLREPRGAGVLMHPTSLPGPGIGDIGPAAHRWVEWLAGAGQTVWQILPLVPVSADGSPYGGLSALAGNELLISPALLAADGLLAEAETADPGLASSAVDYPAVIGWKDGLLRAAYSAFAGGAAPGLREPFRQFCREQAGWLDDYALFRVLRGRHREAPWTEWPAGERRRDAAALGRVRNVEHTEVERHAFSQFLFDRQWRALRARARRHGVRIIGDVPIFVAHDSADVWSHPDLFQLDGRGMPEVVAGVPPDAFSETGQRWGNPVPRWSRMAERGFPWWTERLRRVSERVDITRIDHFRGFQACWEISPEEETAVNGTWRPGPGAALFRALEAELGLIPLIAEDLGLITPEVEALRDELGLPGMRVLQFAIDGQKDNPHHPANHLENAVAYTGTHDNDTVVGWYGTLDAAERRRVDRLAGTSPDDIHWPMIRCAFGSPATLAITPLQDVLGLGSEARMNTPARADGNWRWRVMGQAISPQVQRRLRDETVASGRAGDR